MKLLVVLMCSLIFQFTSAQQLNFRKFSYEEGLNTYNIQKTVQDVYGFIWIATQDGLYRYNGKTFEAFRKLGNGNTSLRENFIFDIDYAGKDILYVAEFNGGIDAINVRTLSISHLIDQQSSPKDGLPNLWIKKIYCDVNNNLWIGGKDYLTIYNSKEKKFRHLVNIPGFAASINVSFIKPIGSQIIAVGVEGYGILLYDQKTQQLRKVLDNLALYSKATLYRVSDICQVHNELYISSNIGIIKGELINYSWKFKELICPIGIKYSIINCIYFDGVSRLWIGTNSGLGQLDIFTKDFTLITSQKDKNCGLEDNTINNVMIDNKNYLWISTTKILQLVNLNFSPFKHYSGDGPGNTRMNHVYSLVPKSKNEIFLTATDGLYIANLITGSTSKVENSTSLGIVHYIMQIRPKIWLVSCDDGMFAYLPEKKILSQNYLLKLFPEWKPYIKNYFNASVTVLHNVYWASEEQEGLLIWDTVHHLIKRYKTGTITSKGIPENHIHNLKQDREGNLWLLFDNSVAKYNISKDSIVQVIKYIPGTKTFNAGIFFDLFDDGETLWFGTYGGGINGYNRKQNTWKYITEKEGLCNNCIYTILPEKDSVFWVSTNMGISRVNYVTAKCNNYYFEDGLQDNSFDEKGALINNDKLLFGGINGFTLLDPKSYHRNTISFPVYINKIEYLYKGNFVVLNNLNWGKLRLPAKTSSLIVHLSALYFSNSKKIKFIFKTNGNQEQSIDVGADNRIVLNTLDYNDNELIISYINENGELINNALTLYFFIEPSWYQTWWFKFLMIAVTLGIMFGFYRFRINSILKEQKMRKAIASDLHDDLGSSLNGVKIFTHLAIADPSKKEHLNMVKQNLDQALMSLRDLIWVLDDKLDTVSDLVNRLQRFFMPIAEALNISLRFGILEAIRDRPLSKAEKKNLYLITKEAINNSLKYAACKSITVDVTLQAQKLLLTIEDNGKGFDQKLKKGGYGLTNIEHRATQIHFKANVLSMEGRGTKITVISKSK